MADDAVRVRRELLDDDSKRMTAAERVRMRQQQRMMGCRGGERQRNSQQISSSRASIDSRSLDRQQLELRLEETEAKSNQSLEHSLRLAHEAEETGAATMQKMLEQREQMLRTTDVLAEAHDDIRATDHILKGMRSAWYRMGNWFRKLPTQQARDKEADRMAMIHAADPASDGIDSKHQSRASGVSASVADKKGHKFSGARKWSGDERVEVQATAGWTEDPILARVDQIRAKQDEQLEALSGAVRNLRVLATDMSEELELHDELLDEIDGQASELNDKIREQNRTMRRMI